MRLLMGLIAAGGLVASLGVAAIDLQNPFFNDLPALAAVMLLPIVLGSRWAKITALLAGLIWLGTTPRPSGPVSSRVIVLGVDGATFDIIDAQRSVLPNFSALEAEGTRAILTSMEPMFSPLLWTTIASGRGGDEHGIRGFHVQSSDCKVARFWDVAESKGMGLGLYKWLVDYPPREVDGFWVPSWLAPAPETWPPELSVVKEVELARRLKRKQVEAVRSTPELAWGLIQVGVRLSTMLQAVAWSAEERLLTPKPERANPAMQQIRGAMDRDVFIAQLIRHQPEVATFTYYATDGLAHLYWDRYEAEGGALLDAYRQADDILGEIRAVMGPQTRLIVISDHGFKAMDGSGEAGQFAPNTERLRARLSEAVGPIDITKVGHKLTVAFTSSEQRAKGEAWLATLLDGSGQPAYRIGDYPGNTLAISLTLSNEEITSTRLEQDTIGGEPLKDYVKLTEVYTGTHDARGIFYAYGPGVPAGQRLDALGLMDVAPTILAALEIPAARNMPGRVHIFPELERVESWDGLIPGLRWLGGQDGVNEDQLKALGYIEE